MKKLVLLGIFYLFIVFSCEKVPYSDYPDNLFGDIEKTWHFDSISIEGERNNRRETLSCVADDKYVFRYDKTLTYFNNQTEYFFQVDGWACGDSNVFEIQLWDFIQDTLLEIDGTIYEIDLLEKDEMVLRLENPLRESGYDYRFFYPRD
ncbi:hypothetical protein ACFLT1_01340 [Bacteroidota bacterium]